MRRFARIEEGIVAELFPSADFPSELIPTGGDIRSLYHPEFTLLLEEVTDLDLQPQAGWTYINGAFAVPVPYIPAPNEILASNKLVRDQLLQAATLAIAPLQDAVELDEANTDETDMLTKWKQYRVSVNRVDLSIVSPNWPTSPI